MHVIYLVLPTTKFDTYVDSGGANHVSSGKRPLPLLSKSTGREVQVRDHA